MGKVLLAVVGIALAITACAPPERSACSDCVTCSGRGRCSEERNIYPECICNDGFEEYRIGEDDDELVYLECIPAVTRGDWVFVPANRGTTEGTFLGEFRMGSPASELGRGDDEDRREVLLTHDIIILSTEVTQGFFEEMMDYNPSADFFFAGPDYPVQNVTWHEAAAFCNSLSFEAELEECYECTGDGSAVRCEPVMSDIYECYGYRLPTEAEWELSARVDTDTATPLGDLESDSLECEEENPALDTIAWYCGNAHYQPHAVGTKESADWHSTQSYHPYDFGWRHLHDMLGNVEEWCNDWYGEYEDDISDPEGPANGTERAHRGGSFESQAQDARAATRGHAPPDEATNTRGFRVVRTMEGFRR